MSISNSIKNRIIALVHMINRVDYSDSSMYDKDYTQKEYLSAINRLTQNLAVMGANSGNNPEVITVISVILALFYDTSGVDVDKFKSGALPIHYRIFAPNTKDVNANLKVIYLNRGFEYWIVQMFPNIIDRIREGSMVLTARNILNYISYFFTDSWKQSGAYPELDELWMEHNEVEEDRKIAFDSLNGSKSNKMNLFR